MQLNDSPVGKSGSCAEDSSCVTSNSEMSEEKKREGEVESPPVEGEEKVDLEESEEEVFVRDPNIIWYSKETLLELREGELSKTKPEDMAAIQYKTRGSLQREQREMNTRGDKGMNRRARYRDDYQGSDSSLNSDRDRSEKSVSSEHKDGKPTKDSGKPSGILGSDDVVLMPQQSLGFACSRQMSLEQRQERQKQYKQKEKEKEKERIMNEGQSGMRQGGGMMKSNSLNGGNMNSQYGGNPMMHGGNSSMNIKNQGMGGGRYNNWEDPRGNMRDNYRNGGMKMNQQGNGVQQQNRRGRQDSNYGEGSYNNNSNQYGSGTGNLRFDRYHQEEEPEPEWMDFDAGEADGKASADMDAQIAAATLEFEKLQKGNRYQEPEKEKKKENPLKQEKTDKQREYEDEAARRLFQEMERQKAEDEAKRKQNEIDSLFSNLSDSTSSIDLDSVNMKEMFGQEVMSQIESSLNPQEEEKGEKHEAGGSSKFSRFFSSGDKKGAKGADRSKEQVAGTNIASIFAAAKSKDATKEDMAAFQKLVGMLKSGKVQTESSGSSEKPGKEHIISADRPVSSEPKPNIESGRVSTPPGSEKSANQTPKSSKQVKPAFGNIPTSVIVNFHRAGGKKGGTKSPSALVSPQVEQQNPPSLAASGEKIAQPEFDNDRAQSRTPEKKSGEVSLSTIRRGDAPPGYSSTPVRNEEMMRPMNTPPPPGVFPPNQNMPVDPRDPRFAHMQHQMQGNPENGMPPHVSAMFANGPPPPQMPVNPMMMYGMPPPQVLAQMPPEQQQMLMERANIQHRMHMQHLHQMQMNSQQQGPSMHPQQMGHMQPPQGMNMPGGLPGSINPMGGGQNMHSSQQQQPAQPQRPSETSGGGDGGLSKWFGNSIGNAQLSERKINLANAISVDELENKGQ